MALFNFRTPGPEETAAIRFADESGVYSLGDLLNALWIRVAGLPADADWLQWYRLVARFIGYARLDAHPGTCAAVGLWPTSPEASCAAGYVFRDETGEVPLTELVRAIGTLAATQPTLATRLARTIIRIAEVDQRRDRVARALLVQAELLAPDQ